MCTDTSFLFSFSSIVSLGRESSDWTVEKERKTEGNMDPTRGMCLAMQCSSEIIHAGAHKSTIVSDR